MASNNIIVFGPTGGVGSAAAITAQKHGAKVFLAMRDVQKSIPGLSPQQEQEGGFARVQADLVDPDSISAAVKKTGAKKAFIYIVFGSPDNMRSSLTALKSAGIDLVVFLSSDGIREVDVKAVPQSSFISWVHAQVEISLSDIFGADGFVAIRPAWFASNANQWKSIRESGELKLVYPDGKFDWISPKDIGAVSGTVVAKGLPAGEPNVIRLWGPQLISQREAAGIIGKAIGKDIKITVLNEQQGLERSVKEEGLPEPIAKQLINVLKLRAGADANEQLYNSKMSKQGSDNIRKYAGKEPTVFQQWVEENKQNFTA